MNRIGRLGKSQKALVTLGVVSSLVFLAEEFLSWNQSRAQAKIQVTTVKNEFNTQSCQTVSSENLPTTDEDYIEERATCLHSPASTALPYDVREPLRNGKNVPVKKRWIEVPPGQSIDLLKTADGKWVPRIPDGSKLWKEFYLETDLGVELIERRLTLKVSEVLAQKAHLDPGGWFFVTAYTPPTGSAQFGRNPWDKVAVPMLQGSALKSRVGPGASLPIQRRPGPLSVAFDGHTQSDYMFPGSTACYQCHGGASSGFRSEEDLPTLAFGIHPDNLTPESLKRLVSRGVVKLQGLPADSQEANQTPEEQRHQKFWGLLRNNCLSCHNPDPLAAAKTTGFVLDPNVHLDRRALAILLSKSISRRNAEKLPIVTPGKPSESELILRLKGESHRRRMPPVEGGVPNLDTEFLETAIQWVQETAGP